MIGASPAFSTIQDYFGPELIINGMSISAYVRGGTYVDNVYDNTSRNESDGNGLIPTSTSNIGLDDFIGAGFHQVDSCSFTSGVNGTYTGAGTIFGIGTGVTGMTSFGDSPAWNLNFGIVHESSAGYIYIGSSADVTSAANYANTGYSSFVGIQVITNGSSYLYTIYDTDYYGYTYSAGYYTFAWGPLTYVPLTNNVATTVYKLDIIPSVT